MAGEGLDDELLALAGESGRKQIDLSSDDEDRVVRTGSKRESKPSTTSSSSLAKKRRLDLLDESASGSDADAPGSSDEDSDADARRDPYPYQQIYKNAKDMHDLMSMNELDREDILARRRDEINKRRQKFELAALVKAQKAAAGATRKQQPKKRVVRGGARGAGRDDSLSESDDDDRDEEEEDGDSDFLYGKSGAATAAKSRKKKLPGQTDAKSAKLSELRKKRKEKAAGISTRYESDDEAATFTKTKGRRGYASDSASEVSYSDYSDEEDYPRRGGKTALSSIKSDPRDSSEPPSLADLNAARITRDQIESRLYAPRWRDILTGSFIRFSWGTRPSESNPSRTETVYRIHQITDILEKPGKFYDLSSDRSGKWCNVYLVFEHAGNEHEAKINMLSRGEFTDSERDRWIAFVNSSSSKSSRVPRKAAVGRKADELEKFFTSPLTEADIGKMLETKKRLRLEAISVMGGSAVLGATAGFDSPKTPGGATPTTKAGVDGVAEAKTLEARLAEVNVRNRALDKSKQSDVERKARNSKIAAMQAERAKLRKEEEKQQGAANGEGEGEGGVELTNAKVGESGMGNGFVAVKNYSTLVEVDLGDF
ncbi:RNA polymerase-associated protein RTF1 [Pseudozyma hubeiensis]|nr:RNA polymerase-associated protein RTF1 [Pseudozyma hubeiensis]